MQQEKNKVEQEAKVATNAKVPLTLIDSVVKYIMNSKSDYTNGTVLQIVTQLQKCEKI